jgi:adenine-specific DNA-methyltransferase
MEKFRTIGYMGSKAKLCDQIFEETRTRMPEAKTFADLFAGSCIVTYHALYHGYSCVSNDLEKYSCIILKGLKVPYTERLQTIIDDLNDVIGIVGNITIHYSPIGNRKYFTEENAMTIDAIIAELGKLKDTITEDEHNFLTASFVIAADLIKNVSVSFSGFLKEFKSTALKKILIKPLHTRATDVDLTVHNEDATELKVVADVIYIDPPYNTSQYGGGFFMLNQLLEFDPVIRGKSGICEYNKSTFCRKREVEDAFRRLLTNNKAKLYILSYSNESLLTKDDLIAILNEFGTVNVIERPHKRFRCNFLNPNPPTHTTEYLFFVKTND